MSLSHIIDVISPRYAEVYRKELGEETYQKIMGINCDDFLSKEDEHIIKRVVEDFIAKVDESKNSRFHLIRVWRMRLIIF
jgi:hypothetical protein